MTHSRWNIPRGEVKIPQELLDLGCTPLLAAILNTRGLGSAGEAGPFLEGDRLSFYDPFLIPDLETAAARLRRAIEQDEHVAVYGDYDVDGITSSCMMADYLRSAGLRCEIYIPNRMEEGYGVNAAAIEKLHRRGVTLIVTVDCGVTTVEETAYAASLGVDMIITDHHECRETLPPAEAVVDPKRPDCRYPNTDLAGVGVAFKLLCAMEGSAEAVVERYADLIALGTVADVMPLTGENRIIVRKGLEKLRTAPHPGLRALVEEAGMAEKKFTAAVLGFSLAPRLNAAGRLGRVECATNLLLTEEPRIAADMAAELCRLNRDRQELETGIWQDALEMLHGAAPEGPIVLAKEGWHQGVIGIAASRLTDAFNVPAVMICLDGDHGKGSCRSCAGFNIFSALRGCGEYLEGYGGHALAAGLTIRRENIPLFREALSAWYQTHRPQEGPSLDIDFCVTRPELLSMECVEDLERLEPCGAGNPRPLLCICGAKLTELTPIGRGRHMRVRLSKFNRTYDAVYFGCTQESLSPALRVGSRVDAAFTPQINTFRGQRSLQLLLTELRPYGDGDVRRILSGTVEPSDSPDRPSREEFAQVWRALRQNGDKARGPVPYLSEILSPGLREEKLCLILKVFQELGLAALDTSGEILGISILVTGKKVDLASSRLLSRLEEASAGQT